MSNAYNSASLLVTPNGYEAGTIFSAKPTDGSGDLSFSRASTATRVNSQGLIEVVANNIPRLNYPVGGGCPSWLFEPQATNTITFSEDAASCFSSLVGVTITANNTNSPDGTLNADRITFNSPSSYILRGQVVAAATTYTMSVFVKNNNFTAGESLVFNMSDGVIGGLTATIDVFAKTATFTAASGAYTSVSGSVQDYGNGWFRVRITGTSVNGGNGWYEFSNATSRSCFLWGFSLEIGSVATSYIPTAGSAVTRLADNISQPLSQIGGYEGTFYYEGSFIDGAIEGLVLFGTSIGINSITIGRTGGGNIQTAISANSVFQSINGPVIAPNTFCKIAVTYKSGVGCALFVNGVKYNGAILTFSSPLTDFRIGDSYWIGGKGMSLKPMGLYQTALSDSEAIALTTL